MVLDLEISTEKIKMEVWKLLGMVFIFTPWLDIPFRKMMRSNITLWKKTE
jgi:hypothetical protein